MVCPARNPGVQATGTCRRVQLHECGWPVGLLLMRWGRRIEETQILLRETGVLRYAKFLIPRPRIALQRLMASCDLVWDQFAYANFGALAIKAMEQAVQLLSHPMSSRGSALMGAEPPYLVAQSTEQIVHQTIRLMAASNTDEGEEASRIGRGQRAWLLRRHHHSITRDLVVSRYGQLASGEVTSAKPDAWALAPDAIM